MPIALSPLLMALAAPSAGQPAVVLATADPAPRAALATRCGPASSQGDGSEVECLVEQPRAGGEARPAMRILIRTTPAAAECLPAAPSVTLLAPETPAPGRALPVVVQGATACR